ncbi:hypothetical protein U27_04021 [Candidatus Vecturithrix granuli]|uniref:Uncharacterized protein n=1 Tax=Vecturithrix granuli TaxID=1499967 RepID=A0A081BXK2_VECG1|nr:hypothetical protein U27_04021 [Candidatus Vecturithrix granuli]
MYKLPELTSAEQISSAEKAAIDDVIARCLETHRQNRQRITQLTLESVTALTASEARAKELRRQGFFQRLWRHLTGKNLAVQTQIAFELAQAQYASQRTLQQLAEQHLLTFDVVTAVNNKLNTLTLDLEEELLRVYEVLKEFFASMRSELVSIHEQIDHLERNVNLLHWSHTIAYQRYQGLEYAELSQNARIVCVVNDFFQSTQGVWSTSDLMVLKATLAELGVEVKGTLTSRDFFETLLTQPALIERLFQGIPAVDLQQLQMFDAPLLKGIEKLQYLQEREAFLVESLLTILQNKGASISREEVQLTLLQHYLRQYADMRIEQEVNLFDFALELLVGLRLMVDLGQQVREEEAIREKAENPQTLSAPDAAEQSALDQRLLGRWRCEWYLPHLNYCSGQLEILRKIEAGHYLGRLSLDNVQLSEEAAIVVQGDRVQIECSNPSQATWPPDSFDLTLDRYADVMTGTSKHPRGFRGKITLTKDTKGDEVPV